LGSKQFPEQIQDIKQGLWVMASVVCGSDSGNGAKISYRQTGEGSDVILIHGLAANGAFWQLNLVQELAQRHRVTVFDLRGHGYSEITMGGYRACELAEDLRDLMDHLGIAQATLIAHSYGGNVALAFVDIYPARVERLVLADTRVHAIQPSNYAHDWPNAESALPRLKSIGIEIPVDERDSGIWLLEELAKPHWRTQKEKLRGSPLYMPFGPWSGGKRSADKWLYLLASSNARQQFTEVDRPSLEGLTRIKQPVLAYYGSHSTLQASFAGLAELLPNCRTAIAEQAGHFFPASQPKVFGQQVASFLAETEFAVCSDKRYAHTELSSRPSVA
jgi:pimeloyl-ACP methyl ester carboxylesterase